MSTASTSTSNTSPASSSTTPVDLLSRPPIKRARPQLSCTPCRQGKLKCNREHPVCDQCSKRSRHDACQYVPAPTRSKQTHNMRARIRNLESMVVSLMNQKSEEKGEPQEKSTLEKDETSRGPVEDATATSFGQLHIKSSGDEVNYVGAGHWSALLKEIEDAKDGLDEEDDDEFSDDALDIKDARSTISFGIPRRMSKAMLIQEMPPKPQVDKLLPLLFNSGDHAVYAIHAPTFLEEYNRFWKDPDSMPVMWIAFLYSCLALAVVLGPRNPGLRDEVAALNGSNRLLPFQTDQMPALLNRFEELASSAFALADISKPQAYTVEALIVFIECNFHQNNDRQASIWLMNGVLLRVALKMGYHRDPSHFPGITPYQGEMRRRHWHILYMTDTLISFAVGLPSGLRRVEDDVAPPLNIRDTDFSVYCKELPKERPISEITSSTYFIAKSRICTVFAEAAELLHRVTPPKYHTIMALDKRLTEAHDLVPPGMRIKPLEDSLSDSPVLVMSRFNVEVLYQKTRIVLHRTFFVAGHSDQRFAQSRKECVDAAMQLLRHQRIVFHACQPGGQLSNASWYMSSLSTYDYLLGAMILCLEVNHICTIESSPNFKGSSDPQLPELLSLLESAYAIWAEHPARYNEVARAAESIRTILKKCSQRAARIAQRTDLEGVKPERDPPSAASEPTPPDDAPSSQYWGPFPPAPDTMDMVDLPTEIDWAMWDNAMQGQTSILPQSANVQPDPFVGDWNYVPTAVDSSVDHMFNIQDSMGFQNSFFFR